MKNYIALFMAPIAGLDEMKKSTDPKRMTEMNDRWNAWMEAHQDSFVDRGSMLGKNKRVTKDSIKDVRNELTGFSIVKANSPEGAAKIFQDNPQLDMPGSYIDVIEWYEMPKM